MNTYQYKLQGLTCEACVKIVKKILSGVDGVKEVFASLDGDLKIDTDREIEKSEFVSALKDTNYKIL